MPCPVNCVGNRAPNTSASPIVPQQNKGDKFSKNQLNNLRNALRIEITRWRQHAFYSTVGNPSSLTATVQANDKIGANDMNSVNNQLQIFGGTANVRGNAVRPKAPNLRDINPLFAALQALYVDKGKPMRAADYQLLRNNYENMRQDCICHSDCVLNNSGVVCALNCGCNYSDKRLKTRIYYC